MKSRTPDEIMKRMGFPVEAKGLHIDALRESVAQQHSHGLVDRSPGTWASSPASLEERAKELLAWDWAIARGHSAQVELLGGMRSYRDFPAWVRDRVRQFTMSWRVFHDRHIMRRRNPYL